MDLTNQPLSNAPRLEEFQTVLRVCQHLRSKEMSCKSLRDIAEHLGEPASTLSHQIRRVVNYLVPGSDAHVSGGIGREPIFKQNADQTLSVSLFGELLESRIVILIEFLEDFQRRACSTSSTGSHRRHREVKIGAPQTLTHRLLAHAFSSPALIHHEPSPIDQPVLDLLPGNSYRDLIPRLNARLVDFVVGYGDVRVRLGPDESEGAIADDSEAFYSDADIQDDVAFSSLGYPAKMVLLCHPSCRLKFKGRPQPVWARDLSKTDPIAPEAIDFRENPLIAVPSWRQPPMLQFLMDEARRIHSLREVNQFDDALSLVRVNSGVAIIGQAFSGRRGVLSFQLRQSSFYERPVGIFYNRHSGLSPDACRYAEFLRSYISAFQDRFAVRSPNIAQDELDPNGITVDKAQSLMHFDKNSDWSAISLLRYPPK